MKLFLLTALLLISLRIPVARSVSPENMVLFPAGNFQMGRQTEVITVPKKEEDSYEKKNFKPIPESPVHAVTLRAYTIDVFEVTNREFRTFVKQNPEWNIINARGKQGKADMNYLRHWDSNLQHASSDNPYPVVYVSWFAADAYCQTQGKRLPSEAEWEYAAQASPSGDSVKSLKAHAWFYFNSLQTTHPVQSKIPNAQGIYHLLGNVWEWTQDWYTPTYYQIAPKQNPLGPQSGIGKVIRGGGWNDGPERLRATTREYVKPRYAVHDLGFRCARSTESG